MSDTPSRPRSSLDGVRMMSLGDLHQQRERRLQPQPGQRSLFAVGITVKSGGVQRRVDEPFAVAKPPTPRQTPIAKAVHCSQCQLTFVHAG